MHKCVTSYSIYSYILQVYFKKNPKISKGNYLLQKHTNIANGFSEIAYWQIGQVQVQMFIDTVLNSINLLFKMMFQNLIMFK